MTFPIARRARLAARRCKRFPPITPESSRAFAATGWEHFRHGADIGIRGWGADLAAAFEAAAVGLTAVITDPAEIRCVETIEVRCAAPTPELLLYDWLNAVIFEMATRRMLFARFEVAINGNVLSARAHGEPVCHERHEPAVEIKGATMTELGVSEVAPGQWQVQCVVDV